MCVKNTRELSESASKMYMQRLDLSSLSACIGKQYKTMVYIVDRKPRSDSRSSCLVNGNFDDAIL